jgi:hypothetical protein
MKSVSIILAILIILLSSRNPSITEIYVSDKETTLSEVADSFEETYPKESKKPKLILAKNEEVVIKDMSTTSKVVHSDVLKEALINAESEIKDFIDRKWLNENIKGACEISIVLLEEDKELIGTRIPNIYAIIDYGNYSSEILMGKISRNLKVHYYTSVMYR